jgi:Anti-sigma-K factor rskA/Putative zinc-finger
VTAHHETWELLPDVAAGVMPAEERETVEAHLDDCPICRAELDTLRSAVELLSGAPAMLDPPTSLRARVLSIPEAAEREQTDDAVPVLDQGRRRSTGGPLGGTRRLVVAAAVALVAAAAVVGGVLAFRNQGFQADRTVSMRDGKGSWAQAQFAGDKSRDVAMRLKAHLPPNGKGWYYEVWLGKPHQRLSLGDFTVDQSRDATIHLNVPRGSEDEYLWIWVTREEDDGNTSPGPVVLRAKLNNA